VLPLRPSSTRFPIPDWPAIESQLEKREHTFAELDEFWTQRARTWVTQLRDAFGTGYRGYESAHFWLISNQPESTSRRLITWAEETRTKVNNLLGDAAGRDEIYGKCPILVVPDLDVYYEYYAGYLPDGEYGASSGVYLNHGYGHFLFSYLNLGEAHAVLAHELAHSLVCHLALPLWVNEGVAQLCEMWSTGRDATRYDEIKESIDTYWTAATIQEFWNGRGFRRADEGQMHSYHLAKVLIQKLTGDLKRFRAFLREVDFNDHGTAALEKFYDTTPAAMVTDYLGEGDWEPKSIPLAANDHRRSWAH
jgi:hypothetical protein